jgi:hypothetical protein
VDVPGGISQGYYESLLNALANAGVIERGYASASIERGFSCVRLPWVKKPMNRPMPAPMPVSGNSPTDWND